MATATDYDYTQEQVQDVAAEDFKIAQVQAPTKDAAQIEAENSFDEIPPGQYEVVVVGFLDKPKAERKELYCDDERAQKLRYDINTFSVVVKFALVEDNGKQVTDYMLLPPSNDGELYVYYNGSKAANNKGKGFHANKFFHFLERLFPGVVQKNQPLPAEACRLGNWIGRRIVLTVEEGDPYEKKVTNTDTGEDEVQTKAGRNQVKLYSYREAGTPVTGAAQPTAPMRAPGTPAGPNGAARPTRPSAVAPQAAAPANRGMTSPNRPAGTAGHPTAVQAPRGPVAPQGAPQRPAAPQQAQRPAPQRQAVAAGDRGLSNI